MKKKDSSRKDSKSKGYLGKIFILIVFIFIVIYPFIIEPKLLFVNEYTIENDMLSGKPELRIVQFSDVHLGDHYSLEQLEKVVEKINMQNPDIVVFSGDLIDSVYKYAQVDEVAPILKKINSRYGKFAVWGNHDAGGGGKKVYPTIMEESGFQLLVNESRLVTINENFEIMVSGLDDAFFGTSDFSKVTDNEKYFSLIISHEPDLVTKLGSRDMDLFLAGHSHGGQVSLPFYGPVLLPPYAKIYKTGMYDYASSGGKIFVNTGIGTTKIPVRLFVPPSIAVFNLN